jgi:hypothetical protein
MILVIRGQDRPDFRQSRCHRRHERVVGEPIHQQACRYQGGRFLDRKMHRWKVVTPYDTVSDASLADDWHPGFCKRSDIAVNRSNACFELICNLLGARHPAALQMNQNSYESIDAIHIAYLTSVLDHKRRF